MNQPSASLIASDGADRDVLGWSVAAAGDTVVASARDAVYVFVKPEPGWNGTLVERTKLTILDGVSGPWFPRVALAGETLAIGVPYEGVGPNADQGTVPVLLGPTPPSVPSRMLSR